MPVCDDQIDRFPDTTDRKPDGSPDACPFCRHIPVHHQILSNGIRSWACSARCGWWRFVTPDGVVEEQDRVTWEAACRWRQDLP